MKYYRNVCNIKKGIVPHLVIGGVKLKKNKKNQLFAMVTASAMMTGAVVIPVDVEAHRGKDSKGFKDVKKNNSHHQNIRNLADRNLIRGYSDGTFRPNEKVTRAQVASIIANVLGINTTNVPNPGFSDVNSNSTHYPAIAALVDAGVMGGYGDDTFRPNEPLKRGHMSKILAKAFEFKTNGTTTPFVDVNSTEYKEFVEALYENGITTGTDKNRFNPEQTVTRGQLATFIIRCEGKSKRGGGRR